jgi:hypothetical protein
MSVVKRCCATHEIVVNIERKSNPASAFDDGGVSLLHTLLAQDTHGRVSKRRFGPYPCFVPITTGPASR